MRQLIQPIHRSQAKQHCKQGKQPSNASKQSSKATQQSTAAMKSSKEKQQKSKAERQSKATKQSGNPKQQRKATKQGNKLKQQCNATTPRSKPGGKRTLPEMGKRSAGTREPERATRSHLPAKKTVRTHKVQALLATLNTRMNEDGR